MEENLSQSVNGVTGGDHITKMWKDKCSCLLNDFNDATNKEDLRQMLADTSRGLIKLTCEEELLLAAIEIPSNKSSGLDTMPSEFYKYAPACSHVWLADILIVHEYLPKEINHVVKSNTLNPSDSSKYRPIVVFNSALKLIEKVIFSRTSDFLVTSDRQFCFQQNHSTTMCILALKETVCYYHSLNSVFAYFMDIKSAFNWVKHGKLSHKLHVV